MGIFNRFGDTVRNKVQKKITVAGQDFVLYGNRVEP